MLSRHQRKGLNGTTLADIRRAPRDLIYRSFRKSDRKGWYASKKLGDKDNAVAIYPLCHQIYDNQLDPSLLFIPIQRFQPVGRKAWPGGLTSRPICIIECAK